MNKADLISALNKEFDITKVEAAKVVSTVFDEMANALANGDRVEIRGLFSFYVKQYESYTGRNPKILALPRTFRTAAVHLMMADDEVPEVGGVHLRNRRGR